MTGPMRVSPLGIAEIALHEGIVPAPYLDSRKVWTFGIGHTAAAGEPDPERMERAWPDCPAKLERAVAEAAQLFALDLEQYEDRVRRAITVPLAQHQFDALVSFDFNTGGIFRAKLRAAINVGHPDAARHFMGWLRPPEIRGRREAEMRLFAGGEYLSARRDIPVWRTDGRGRLVGIEMGMTADRLVALMTGAAAP